jgi:hypothetical protein
MCLMRVTSSGLKLNLGHAHDIIAEVAAEIRWGAEVDSAATEEARKFTSNLSQSQQAGLSARLEFDEQVHIAVRPVSASQRRTEQREAPDVAPAANGGQGGLVGKDADGHGGSLAAAGKSSKPHMISLSMIDKWVRLARARL